MNNSSLFLPQSAFATPLHSSLQSNPFASSKSLAPFSPDEALPALRSSRHPSKATLLQLDTAMFELPAEGCVRSRQTTKQKRKTLPCHLLLEGRGKDHCLQGLLSPSHLAKLSPRISFTYRTPASNSRSQLTTAPTSLLQRNASSKIDLRWPLPRRKAEKNKICSNQFSFAFVPRKINKIEDYNFTLTSSIRTIPTQEESQEKYLLDVYRTESPRRRGCESKVASTIASSGIPLRDSQFSQTDSYLNRQNGSQIRMFGSSSRNLLDRMPTKQLGKTIILPTHYSFGGLIDQPFPNHTLESLSRKEGSGLGELQSRQWRNHVRFLVEEGDDMKESIHCGPEMRVEHKFEMLGGYGREIKESTTSFCE